MDEVILNLKSGETGTFDDWIALFAMCWEDPKARLDRMLALYDEHARFESPTSSASSREMARQSILRVLRAMPDLTATVNGWQMTNGHLFIDMTFEASIGGRVVKWPNTDRVRFHHGMAVERISYFDPQPVHRAFLRNPKGWSQYARLQAGV